MNIIKYFFLLLGVIGLSSCGKQERPGIDLTGMHQMLVGGKVMNIPQAAGPRPIWLTALSAMFMHAGFVHLIGNMLYLWIFGDNVEHRFGHRVFLAFYLVSIVISGLCQIAISPNPVIGASGGVMAVVFLTAMYYPRMTVLLFFILPIELRWLAVLYAVVDLFGFVNPRGDSVAHFAHLGGAAFGVAYKYFGWNLTHSFQGKWNRFQSNRAVRKSKLKVYSEPNTRLSKARLDERVDAILEKISREGEASLTDQERELLKEASSKYKKR